MQIFKNTLLACFLVVAVSPFCLRAEDSAAQAAARAALQQKMRELGGAHAVQSDPAPTEVVPPKPVEPVMVEPAPAPRVRPPAVSKPSAANSDLIEQAREATRARLRELQNNPATSIPAGQESPAPQAKPAEVAPGYESYAPAKISKEDAREQKKLEKEREAAAKKAQKEAAENEAAAKKAAAKQAATPAPVIAQAPKTTEAKPAPAVDANARAKKEKAEANARAEAEKAAAKQAAKEAKEAKKHGTMEPASAFAPIEGPASSLSATKEQRLQDLTDKYRADQISAEEYHDQRAKILSEP